MVPVHPPIFQSWLARYVVSISFAVIWTGSIWSAVPAGLEGNYAGTVAGDDQGIFNVSVTADGALVGLAFSLSDQANEAVVGSVAADGVITFGFTSSASTFTGTIAATGEISGAWTNSGDGSSGTFSGVKTFAAPSDIAGNFTGTLNGQIDATFDVNVSLDGSISGTAVSQFGTFAVTGLVNGTSTFMGADSAGGTFSGNIRQDGSFSGSAVQQGAVVATINGKRTTQAREPFQAIATASRDEGTAPLDTTLDAGGSIIPSGDAAKAFHWNFGDGTIRSTAAATTAHTYTTSGCFMATVIVELNSGLFSPPGKVNVVVGDGETDDRTLFISQAQSSVNYKNHAKSLPSDTLKLAGFINPSGLPDDLSGVKVLLSINNLALAPETGVRSRRRSSARAANFIPILKSNGAFSISLTGVDLRNLVDIKNESSTQDVRSEIRMDISGAAVGFPRVVGVIQTPYRVQKDGAAKGIYSHIKLGSRTGVFKSLKTAVAEGSSGGHKVISSGPIEGEFAGALEPEGEITITIGGDGEGSTGATIVIPKSALVSKGVGAKSTHTYSKQLGEIPELLKFQINNASRKFILVTSELNGTGVPAAGAGGTSSDLPIVIVVTTASGPVRLETSVEIKRTDVSSKSWTR